MVTLQVVVLNTLKKTVSELLKNAKLDGFFINHSLRRSSATHLFQAGVDKKIIREITGHRSDTLDKYSVTSDAQKIHVSNVLAGEVGNSADMSSMSKENIVKSKEKGDDNVSDNHTSTCSKQVLSCEDSPKISEMIEKIVKSKKGSKTVVKIEIEIVE